MHVLTQGPNTGAVSKYGHLMIGTQPGSTTQCEGTISSGAVNVSCYEDQVPFCDVLLSQ